MTVRELFRSLVRTLKEGGISSPAREARLLLGKILGTSPSRVYLFWDRKIGEEEQRALEGLVAERLSGVPLQYVLGEWEFFSLPFRVRRGVFIPRVDTEAWVEEAVLFLHFLSGKREKILVGDLCCGSGVVGLSCAFFVPAVFLFGVDIAEEAVALAEENARILGLSDRARFFVGDLFAPLAFRGIVFDVILANPPYVAEEEWEKLEVNIRLYEPKEALLGGEDGLEVIRRILGDAPSFLREGGFLFVEHDPSQREKVAQLGECFGFTYVRAIQDYTGNVRASVLQLRRRKDAYSHRM
ncbi:MAG: peptide chain release factor N(5)-glutamine methyltransferase [Candidatus Caldatribacterium sp.]|nr:peptide chain release factor N(5)-glutamine methyltransferase [Candidatus Caldatribacterium sp.]